MAIVIATGTIINQKCGACDGIGKRLVPPYVTVDNPTWVAGKTTELYPCQACGGAGVFWLEYDGETWLRVQPPVGKST